MINIQDVIKFTAYALVVFISPATICYLINFGLRLSNKKIIYRKQCRFYKENNKCIYTKNYWCFICNDFMEEMVGLDLLQHINLSETKKNRSQQLWLTVVSFLLSSLAFLISIIT
jgi:hypothetical protein